MRFKTRAPKRKHLEILTQKRKRKMESNQDRDRQSVCLDERDALLTFRAHLHLSVGRYWTENVWEGMARHYESLAKSPATVASLKLAWHKYSLQNDLLTLLRDFGVRFNSTLHILYGPDGCWDAAEAKMPDHKELIQDMKGRVIYNYHLLREVFSYFDKNASSINHQQRVEQRIANIEKEVEEMKTKQLADLGKGVEEMRKRQESVSRQIKRHQEDSNKKLKKLVKLVKKGIDEEEEDSDEIDKHSICT